MDTGHDIFSCARIASVKNLQGLRKESTHGNREDESARCRRRPGADPADNMHH